MQSQIHTHTIFSCPLFATIHSMHLGYVLCMKKWDHTWFCDAFSVCLFWFSVSISFARLCNIGVHRLLASTDIRLPAQLKLKLASDEAQRYCSNTDLRPDHLCIKSTRPWGTPLQSPTPTPSPHRPSPAWEAPLWERKKNKRKKNPTGVAGQKILNVPLIRLIPFSSPIFLFWKGCYQLGTPGGRFGWQPSLAAQALPPFGTEACLVILKGIQIWRCHASSTHWM